MGFFLLGLKGSMATSKKKNGGKKQKKTQEKSKRARKAFSFRIASLIPKNRIVRTILWSLTFLFLVMAGLGIAGKVGNVFNTYFLVKPFGYAWWLIPIGFLLLIWKEHHKLSFGKRELFSFLAALFTGAALTSLFSHGTNGGFFGNWISTFLVNNFEFYFSLIFLVAAFAIAVLTFFDPHLHIFQRVREEVDEHIAKREEKKRREAELKAALAQGGIEESSAIEKISEISKRALGKEDSGEEREEKRKKKEKGKKKREEEFSPEFAQSIFSHYDPPPLSLLRDSSGKPLTGDIKANANLIQRTLMNFGIPVELDEISIGPTVTRYAIKPAQGIRLSRIASLQNEIALALAAKSIRIEAPIPGRSLVGIEVPNKTTASIGLGSLLSEEQYQEAKTPLLVSLGKGVSGESYFANLAKMPHVLIAGATGSGKSVTIHNLILSLIYRNGPEMLRFIMIDPKRVELTLYKKIPHLLTPVITDPKKAVLALKWAVREMERRYDVLQSYAVRDIQSYHEKIVAPAYRDLTPEEAESLEGELPEKMPYIVIIIDELSDIMAAYPREMEASIVRLAQMSRAVGIHLVLATQRPSVNVITGLIKANIPTRMALKVTSQIDSRTILDMRGAEKLLGKGDMLYKGEGSNEPVRIQCPFVSEEEVKKVVEYLQKKYRHHLDDAIMIPDEEIGEGNRSFETAEEGGDDPLYEEARAIVVAAQKASTSYLQRRLSIGYSRAARIIDLLEERGVIGPARGSKPREVYEKPAEEAGDPEEDVREQF